MVKRNPEITRRNKEIKILTEKLHVLLPQVLKLTGYESESSLNAKFGSKNADFIDLNNAVIISPQLYVQSWLQGYMDYLDLLGEFRYSSRYYLMYQEIIKYPTVWEYLKLFLQRTYLRNIDALSRNRPTIEESIMWIGQENASYGLLVTPRFKNDNWENDKSEIRYFKKDYWTIGHVLETGLVVPFEDEIITFKDVKQYLTFFKQTLVRASGSKYEKEISKKYSDFVLNSDFPEKVPLLIPEFRYGGLEKKHKYRLDFCIIDPFSLNKIGFELSPWSTHGQLTGIKGKSQKQVNEEAKCNFEKEMKKHKDYYRKYGVFSLIYTDSELQNIDGIFDDMRKYLEPNQVGIQLRLSIYDEFLKYDAK
ncbi:MULTISPECIES: hypothetical protein [Clostridium]|uniref:Topoisomerase II n=1 Tax=Clostridium frigoriphilum TaxID=443253 RepID=A0ABU7UXU7_9CLOT|nr:hypothetical protein [Clostridium sp. DSM 17811]MBU3102245.1 hypothetical protein [Clostridium sp. DSM 17811]